MMDKVCIVSTLKTSVEQTIAFVHYHLNIGIDEIFLFFDDPNDPALVVLESYKHVTTTRCTATHWENQGYSGIPGINKRQKINANIGMKMAKEKSCQWIIHIDSDELIHPLRNLKEILTDSQADILRFSLYEAVPETEHCNDTFSPRVFKKQESSNQRKLALLLRCRCAFFEGEYFRGHTASKVAVRLGSKIVRMGIHDPQIAHDDSVRTVSREIILLHYGCIGLEAWKTKWRGRMDGTDVSAVRKNRKSQFEFFVGVFSRNDQMLKDSYRRLYCLPKYEQRVLRLLKMLTTIHLAESLFERPHDS